MANFFMALRLGLTVYFLIMIGMHEYWAVTAFCVLVSVVIEFYNYVILEMLKGFSVLGEVAEKLDRR